MKYYLVTVDQNYIAPVPVGWYGKIDRKTWKNKKAYQMPKHLIFQTEKHVQMVFTDIVTFPCFMVSKMVRDTIALYNPFVKFVRIILYDKERKKSMAYYMPFMKTIEPAETNNMNIYRNNEIVLERGKFSDEAVIEVIRKDKAHIVMRMDLVESILRRNAVGIGLKEIKII